MSKKNKQSDVVEKEVPFTTVATGSNVPGNPMSQSNIQGTSMPSGTSMSGQSQTWPAPDNWHLQGHNAAKRIALEYIVAASQYLAEQDVARKMELATKMTSIIESLINGLQIGTEAGELLLTKIRSGDEAAKINMANLKQTLQAVANTIWIHNFVALRGAPGLQLRLIDGQLVGRCVRAVGIPLGDDGIRLPAGVDPNSLWLDNQSSENIQALPLEPSAEEGGELPVDEVAETQSPEEGSTEDEVPVEAEDEIIPDEEAHPEGEADDTAIAPDTEIEDIEEQEPDGEQILEDYIDPNEEIEGIEDEPEEGLEDATTGIEEAEEEIPEASEEEGLGNEGEVVVENIEEGGEEPTAEDETGESVGEEIPDESTRIEEEKEEITEGTEGRDEVPEQIEDEDTETTDEELEEASEGEETIEDEAEEESQYCVECDRDVTDAEIDACDNLRCPFKNKKEESRKSENEKEEKHYVWMNTDNHDDCEKYTFVSDEFTGLEIEYCKTCDKAIHYAFDQKSWTSDDACKWMTKNVVEKKVVKKNIQEEAIDELLETFFKDKDNDKIEEKGISDNGTVDDVDIDEDDLKSIVAKAIENSPITKEFKDLKDSLRYIVPMS